MLLIACKPSNNLGLNYRLSHQLMKELLLLLISRVQYCVVGSCIDLITTRRGSYGQAACDITAVVLEVDLGRVNQSR